MARAQVAGRGRDPPGCRCRSESVRLHGEPRQQRGWYVDGSGRAEISAIHYPQRGKLLKEIVRSDVGPKKKPILAIIMSLVSQAIRTPFQPYCWPIKYKKTSLDTHFNKLRRRHKLLESDSFRIFLIFDGKAAHSRNDAVWKKKKTLHKLNAECQLPWSKTTRVDLFVC